MAFFVLLSSVFFTIVLFIWIKQQDVQTSSSDSRQRATLLVHSENQLSAQNTELWGERTRGWGCDLENHSKAYRARRWINWKEPPPVKEVKRHCRQRQTQRWSCFHCHLTRGSDFLCFLCGSAYWFPLPGKWIKNQAFDPARNWPKCNSMLVQDIASRSTHTHHRVTHCWFLFLSSTQKFRCVASFDWRCM